MIDAPVSEIDALAEKILAKLRPGLPVAVALWDLAAIAEYLHRGVSYTRQYIVTQNGFPKRITLPVQGEAKGRPLWRAKDVIEWTESFMQAK